MNFTSDDLKQLESCFVKKQPVTLLDKISVKLSEQGTWRGILMILIAFVPYLREIGLDTDVILKVFSGLATIYGVQNIATRG